jgi:putative ABC transport system ATP-binding protein
VRSERIGFVFQSFHLVPRLTAAENIALPMTLAGIRPAERAKRGRPGAQGFRPRKPRRPPPEQLSGGQRQRVAIARATIMQPAMILADEPTGNLDRATGEEVMRLLEELNASGVTLIVVTHDQAPSAPAPGGSCDGRRRLKFTDSTTRRAPRRRAGAIRAHALP